MTIKETIQNDLKQAMLAADKATATALRTIKSAILDAEVEANKRDTGLTDEEVIRVLTKEAKKRQESIDLYNQGGNQAQAQAEAEEKRIIEAYLPDKLTEAELQTIVDQAVAELGAATMADMGRVMGVVKQKAGPAADGSLLARLVKARLSS